MIDLAAIRAAATAYKDNGLARYEMEQPGLGGMSPGQASFHRSDHQRRILIGGNQIGNDGMQAFAAAIGNGALPRLHDLFVYWIRLHPELVTACKSRGIKTS